MQIFAVIQSDNPIPDKNNYQTTSRKHVNENHSEFKASHIFVLSSFVDILRLFQTSSLAAHVYHQSPLQLSLEKRH